MNDKFKNLHFHLNFQKQLKNQRHLQITSIREKLKIFWIIRILSKYKMENSRLNMNLIKQLIQYKITQVPYNLKISNNRTVIALENKIFLFKMTQFKNIQ